MQLMLENLIHEHINGHQENRDLMQDAAFQLNFLVKVKCFKRDKMFKGKCTFLGIQIIYFCE